MIGKVLVFILLFSNLSLFAQNVSNKPLPNSNRSTDELAAHLSAAETYQISGDLVNAAIENRAVVGIALGRTGNFAIEEGKFDDAIKLLKESIAYFDNAPTRIDLALAYLSSNQLDNALVEAQTAVKLDPEFSYARYILGNIYFTNADYQSALPELEKVMIMKPDFDAARALGLTYLYLRQPERAKLLFEEMQAALKTKSSELHILFGQAYEQTNYPLEAEREFKRALAINPKQARASFYLGYVILQYGGSERLAEAGKAFEYELDLTPNDFFTNFFAGVVASSENDHQKAIKFLGKAVSLNPKSGEANLFLGQSQLELNNFFEAESSLRRVIDLEKSDVKAKAQGRRTHYMLGRLLLKTNRKSEAEKEFAIAQKLQQDSLENSRDEISRILGQVVKETADPANSKSEYVNLKSLSSQRISEIRKAKAYLSEILAQAFYNLGVIAVQNKNEYDALEKFAEASKWKPDFPNLDRNWGIVAFRVKEFDKAITPFARHLKAKPDDDLARRMLGASFYFSRDYKNAAETLKPLESIMKDSELAYFYGVSLVQIQRNQDAVPIFDKLAETSQNDPEALMSAAQGFIILGDFERAVKELRTIAAISPMMSQVNSFVGQSLIRLNRFDEAEQAFRSELLINQNDETAKYFLALTLIERKIKPVEAFTLLQQSVAMRPDYADAHYQLGKIYMEKGDTEKAIEHLETAIISDSKKDYIHYQLSIAYRKAGRKEDADRELKLYSKLKAENRKIEPLVPMGNNKNVP